MTEEQKYRSTKVDEAWDDGDERAFGNNVEYKIPMLDHNIRPRTNQGMNKETKSACTIVGSINQILRLYAISLDTTEANKLCIEVVNRCVKNGGYQIGYGWSTPTAINYVCKWWNETGAERFGTEKVFYLRLDRKDKEVKEALEKGHLVGFTYSLDYGNDRYKGLVYKDNYPGYTGHRTNRKSVNRTTATGGADGTGTDVGVHDSYYLRTNEYFIKDRSKYMGRGMNTPAYLILPQSAMATTVQETKENIANLKAVNSVLGAMSSAYADLPKQVQGRVAETASYIREQCEGSRQIVQDKQKKAYQTIVDTLSYNYKYADPTVQKKLSELASYLRASYGCE